jgi:hypothetical protein
MKSVTRSPSAPVSIAEQCEVMDILGEGTFGVVKMVVWKDGKVRSRSFQHTTSRAYALFSDVCTENYRFCVETASREDGFVGSVGIGFRKLTLKHTDIDSNTANTLQCCSMKTSFTAMLPRPTAKEEKLIC